MQKISDNVSLDRKDDIAILSISNNLSYQTADDLKVAYPLIEEKKILVDLGQVKITTSRGMASLISMILEANDKDQRVCLCNVSQPCMNIIDAMDIMAHVKGMKIFETVEEGIEHFQPL